MSRETLNPEDDNKCPTCSGRGTVPMDGEGVKGIKKCPTCHGKGKLSSTVPGGVDPGSPKPKTLL